MPRSGVLAIGAVAAALLIPALGLAGSTLLAAGLLLGIATARSSGRPGLARLVLAAFIGFVAIGIRLAPTQLDGSGTATTALPDDRGPWTFVVETVGSPRDGSQTATLSMQVAGSSGARGLRVAATLPSYPAVVPGDLLETEGAIRPPPDSPYGRYLQRIGAGGTLRADALRVRPSPDSPGRALEGLRRSAGAALAAILPEPEAGLAAGILIGLRDLVDRDLAAAFTTAGVSHVVAISGWNIAIVAAAVGAFAGRLGRRRRSVVTIVAIVAYIVFAGASASVVRAGLMAGVVLLARESGRAGQAATALGWAVTLLLLADPGLVLDAGLQLSALATAGLIVWATAFGEALDRIGRGHLPAWLTESLGVSLAAQAATLPLILASFGRLSIVAPAVNLVVVPLVAPAMAAGLLAMGAGAVVMAGAPWALGAVLAAPAWVLFRIIVAIVQAAAGLPFASIALAPPMDGLAAVLAGLLIVGLHYRLRGRGPTVAADVAAAAKAPTAATASAPIPPRPPVAIRSVAAHSARSFPATGRWTRTAALVLAVAVLVTGGVFAARPAGVARITVLDVGQGDAILVEGSNGGRLLVDGGPDPTRLLVALDRVLPPWDRRLDAIVLTHPHEDHVAGLPVLLDRYRVSRVFESGVRGPGPGYAAWLERLSRPGAPERRSLAAGDRLTVDEIEMTVLWPIAGKVPLDPPDGGSGINNLSIVLLGSIGPRRFLLTGDAEETVDPSLIAAGLPRLDLLKVAHHGSRTATTQAFLDITRPRVAVISVGVGNPYGHPTKPTLDRLRAIGAQVHRTDREGSVSVTFSRDGMVVRAGGARAADAGPPSIVGYHRPDDRTWAGGGRLPPALPGSTSLVRAARARRGRGGRIPGRPDRGSRDRRGSSPRGVGRPSARHGQGAASGRPGSGARARHRLSGVAGQARAP